MGEMRYIIIGAGAIGGTIGARLFEGGREVVLVARGAHLAALRARGLRFVSSDGESTLRIPAIGEPGELELRDGDGEIVLLGREHGVPVPVNEVLQRLANQAARERRAPGSMAPGEVAALIPA
jgi:ketopantoate reductase